VFLVVAAFALLSTLGVRAAMGPRLTTRTRPVVWGRRPAYAVVAAVGVVGLHLAGHDTGVGAGLLLLGGLALVGVTVSTLLPGGTARARRGLPAVVASRGIFGAAFACVEMFLPLVLQDESRLSPTVTGLVMMVGALGWTAGSTYSGRHGGPETFDRILRLAAMCLVGGAAVSLALVPVDHLVVPAVLLATLGFATMAVGMGLASPLLSTLALDLSPEGRQGESGSAIQMSDALGQSIAAGLVGAVFARWFLLDQDTSYLAGFVLATVLALVATVVVGRCAPRTRSTTAV
jgi:MFS family permease